MAPKKKTQKKTPPKKKDKTPPKRSLLFEKEALGLLLLTLAFFLVLSQLSFVHYAPDRNWLGIVGYSLGLIGHYAFGLSGHVLSIALAHMGIRFFSGKKIEHLSWHLFYCTLFIFSFSILLNLTAEQLPQTFSALESRLHTESILVDASKPYLHLRYNVGGALSYYLLKDVPTYSLLHLLSPSGVAIVFSMLFVVSGAFLGRDVLVRLRERAKLARESSKKEQKKKPSFTEHLLSLLKSYLERRGDKDQLSEKPSKEPRIVSPTFPKMKTSSADEDEIEFSFSEPAKAALPVARPRKKSAKEVASEFSKEQLRDEALRAQRVYNGDFASYIKPKASFLKAPTAQDPKELKKDLMRLGKILEETLSSFGVDGKVGAIHCGPRIASFEVHPPVGVKVQKIKALENDIALNMQAESTRIIAPIPGKAAVGIEIPTPHPHEVSFRELLEQYQNSSKKLEVPMLLGKSVSGEIITADLTKMPHCLIAGATGSGKSVCINTIILSILMTARPDEVKLLMVDPKKVELTGYSELPHMIAPVITEPHGAQSALQWLVKEMQRRYEILKKLGLRNILSFNKRTRDVEMEEALNLDIPEKMPYIVGIIDELADLMMAAPSDIETPIARIAQMARAVGIHLILATQRPSREVITGLIKANFPARLSFKVASKINSQIILDETGAERLLGNGDMLFLPPGTSNTMRAQGAFVSDDEIKKVVSSICMQAPPNYLIDSFDSPSALFTEAEAPKDSLFDQAKDIVVETGSASTTFLQRKLKIGYARAASLMDELEERGVVSAQDGSKPRRVLYKNAEEGAGEV
jgi:DNA segregation ATPase FtsK/SpoIIIE, S-DNA-T family